MTNTLRETLLAKTQRRYQTLTIDGQEITIRSITAAEASGVLQSNTMNESLIVAGVVDSETHEPIFTEADIEQLKQLDSVITTLLIPLLIRFTGLNQDVEEVAKN